MKFKTICFLLFFLSACSADLSDYKGTGPVFDIKEYFSGSVIARGIVQNSSNKVTRRFCVEIKGTWNGDKGMLAEKFYFHDGEISYRNWQLIKLADGSYEGTAEDVIGVAVGVHQGLAFQFNYVLALTVDDSTYHVTMDDWMYQLDDYRVVNKTSMNKLGINVANISLFFDKKNPLSTCNSS